ncbi:PilZ domain-containing protein [bacterium]|nr:PilZ domain-containing protein [bacterium]
MASEAFKAEANAERRRFTRMPIKIQVRFRCLDRGNISEPQADLAEDLGAGGLMMHSEQNLPLNQNLMVIIYLPPTEKRFTDPKDVPEEECLEVEVLSRVAWSAAAPQGGFMIGIQFLDLDQNNRKWLKEFLVDFKLDQPDSSLYT